MQTYVLDVVREQLTRRQAMDASCRNLIRLMTATAGYGEIRTMTALRIEMWIQNPKASYEITLCSLFDLIFPNLTL